MAGDTAHRRFWGDMRTLIHQRLESERRIDQAERRLSQRQAGNDAALARRHDG